MQIVYEPASTEPALGPQGHTVFQLVLEAMSEARQVFEAEDFRDLMADIARAARGERPSDWQSQQGVYQRTVAALEQGLDFDHFADFQALCARTAAEAEARITLSHQTEGAPMAIATYRTEFPDFGDLDVTLPEGFVDASDSQDMCPKFEIQRDIDMETGYASLTVFIDYADPEQRELGEVLRFTATTGDTSMGSTEYFTTSEWPEMLEWIAANRPAA